VVLADGVDRLHATPGTWDVLRCLACGVRFTDVRLSETEMLRHYPAEYRTAASSRPLREAGVPRAVRALALLPYRLRHGPPDRIPAPFGCRRALDVGCGTGAYVRRLCAGGWSAQGIDVDPRAVDLARRHAPEATFHIGTLDQLPDQKSFAYVSMNHVLEHVRRPAELVARCAALLEPGGILSIGVPNIDSVEARVFGSRWIGLDLPRHLTHFDTRHLVGLAIRAGLEVTTVRPAVLASSLSESLLLCLPQRLKVPALQSLRLRRAVYYLVMLPACISYALGSHPAIEVHARKPDRRSS
jgi:2-polyprenyl-3-methyl-5-hydroxy-6-metoxy-1,4-benzoquinol methylase